MATIALEVTVKVTKDWYTQADQEVKVPVSADPKLVGALVADIIPSLVRDALAKIAKDEASAAALAAQADAPDEPIEV